MMYLLTSPNLLNFASLIVFGFMIHFEIRWINSSNIPIFHNYFFIFALH